MAEVRVTPDGIVVNFDGPGPLPEALYHVAVRSADPRVSINGNDIVLLRLEVVEGAFVGRPVFDNIVLLPQCQWHTDKVLRALKGEAHQDGQIPGDWNELVGLDCTVFVSPTERDERIYDDVEDWLPTVQSIGDPGAPGTGSQAVNWPF